MSFQIIESTKTVDKKTFYKTADICQMLICKEGEPSDEDEDEEEAAAKARANAKKKDDPVKVDKKFVHKHGLNPPLKNCRRRRFRKTLRKKYVEAPEIEKEVKRLLRLDNEAVEIKWDLVTEEELAANKAGGASTSAAAGGGGSAKGGGASVPGAAAGDEESNQIAMAEQELFGDLSDDTDDDATNVTGGAGGDGPPSGGVSESGKPGKGKNVDVDSEGDSTMFGGGSASQSANPLPSSSSSADPPVTQFNRDMFHPPVHQAAPADSRVQLRPDLVAAAAMDTGPIPSAAAAAVPGAGAVGVRLDSLRTEISQLRVRKQELERNIANCDNQALLQRFKLSLAEVEAELMQKAEEEENLSMFS